ncbi:hypothetical protein OSB04_015938 [Centaurea solstitialis]|uniref:Uncharacterized protein n=1 Tax=Centaurea solstitialis TaxID=347529 RepID=A0AA38T039_9ASTR|nr:hypothetical protein OSB04_015938 [Centaurea solstitialis]
MIPIRIRDVNPNVFNPRYVNIGPIHRKNKNLEAFEGQKAIFLKDLLDQTSIPQEQTLEKCMEKVKTSIGRIKACYDDGIEWYDDNDITKNDGVKFKPHDLSGRKWSMDFRFEFPLWSRCRPWAKPTLIMPILRIHNYTEVILRNLIAYEHLSPDGLPCYVTSYAVAMDRLIDTHEDVAILVESKVLVNSIGSKEEAAKLINDLRKDVSCRLFFTKMCGTR